MKINNILPYIIHKVNNNSEFIEIQKMLFNQKYCWLSYLSNNHDIIKLSDLQSVKFPFYISNLPYIDHNKLYNINSDRKNKLNFDNNSLFVSENMNDFDLILLRKEKLLKLKL